MADLTVDARPHASAVGPSNASQNDASQNDGERTLHILNHPFTVRIPSPHCFKTLCGIVGNVLTKTHFQVMKSTAFTGLRIDSTDAGMVCAVKAKFACAVEFDDDGSGLLDGMEIKADQTAHGHGGDNGDEHTRKKARVSDVAMRALFCIRMKTLSTILKNVSSQHMLVIRRRAGCANLELSAHDPTDQTVSKGFIANTLEEPCTEIGMFNIDSQYTVQIELADFKAVCKTAKDIKASTICLALMQEQETPSNDNKEPRNETRNLCFEVRAPGEEAELVYRFASSPAQSNDDGCAPEPENIMLARTDLQATGLKNAKLVYQEHFSAELLSLFLKSMERQALQMRLATSGPLLLHYSLGGEMSHIHFILAPKVRPSAT